MDILELRPWTDADLARLYQARLNKVPYRVIGSQLGRTANACEHKWNDGSGWQGNFSGTEDEDDKEAREEEKANFRQKFSDKLDSRMYLNQMRTDALCDRIAEVVKPFNRAPLPAKYDRKKKKGKRLAEEVGLMLSDVHIGQQHTLEDTGGLGEYSLDKYHSRLMNLRARSTSIIENHSELYDLDVLNMFMLGDNVHGMNAVGQWSAAYIENSIIDQVMVGVKSMADLVYYYLTVFKEVRMWCVGGNHGRAAEKGAEKDYVNWDFVIYKFLESMFRDNPRVKLYAPRQWYIYTPICNHKFLLFHGDDVRGGSMPILGMMKSVEKLCGLIRDIPDYVLAGHFHTAAEITTNHGECFLNGSFPGPDMYSLKTIQKGGRPTQKMFGIHPTRGVTWRYNIDLDAS
jgi:hypothetical protein